MTGGWAALNTLRCELQDYGDDILGRPSGEAVAALALVEAALDAAAKLDQEIVLWSKDANDGEFAIWSEDKIMAAWQALAAALRAVRGGK